MSRWTATMLERDYDTLHRQLFQPDHDEHAAFLYAGLSETALGRRLLVRRVVPVVDHEFVPSNRGAYRQIVPRAVARAALECDELGLCLLWAHSHPSSSHSVDFSPDDLAAHAYAHPALIDMTHDHPVAGLVFGEHSVAGEIWAAGEDPALLGSLRVVGRNLKTLTPQPRRVGAAAERFARQVLMFGTPGQQILRDMTVAVVGAGGGGSLLIEMLAHLGVGRIIVVDYDIVDETNLSRIVGATPADVGRLKIDVAHDLAARIDPDVLVDAVYGDIAYVDDAHSLLDADFAFLATDNILSRYAFNLVCHQFLIPGIQVGAKVTGDDAGGIELIHVMERPVTLQDACLDCSGAIPADALTREQLSPEARRAQGYVDGDDGADIEEPSVITLNSISTSLAATDFLLMATGLMPKETSLEASAYYPQERELRSRAAVKRPNCRFCGDGETSALARGDLKSLSLKPGACPPRAVAAAPPLDATGQRRSDRACAYFHGRSASSQQRRSITNPREGRLEMSKNPAIVTGPHPGGGWQNKVEGNQRASNVAPTKAAAQAKGREMAIERKTEHKIQNQNGQIKERNSYGNDPHPPKG